MVTTKAIAKVAAVATGLAMATSMLSLAPMAHAAGLSASQVSSILSLLSSFGADSATIANVNAALTGGAMTGGSTGGSGSSPSCTFTRDLQSGVSGDDVTCLQHALLGAGFAIPALSSGAASFGFYGSQTVHAVAAWQSANSIAPAVGYFGSISRAHWNLGGGSTGGNTGGNTGNPGTGTGLKVSLSATSPNNSVLVAGQGVGDLADFVFANPTGSPITVTGTTFNRTGVSNDSALTNVYLYHMGTRLTDSAGVSNSQFSFSDPNGLFTVPAGSTYVVSVRSDIATGTAGQQIGASLVSVSSTGALDSSVSFPVMSGFQSISAATLATVDYSVAATPSSATSISPQNDYPVWQDTVNVSSNPVKLSSMRFTNLGSIDGSNIINLRLYVDGVQVGSTVPVMNSDRSVTFDLSANPVTLSTQSHVVKVLANITGGASRTIVFSVQRASDGMFIDSQLNQPVTPTSLSGNFSAVSTGTITINSVGANSGVSVSLDPASPSQTVAKGASNVKWASFDMLASGENVKVSDLYVYADTSVHNGGLDNGKVYVNGVQVGSTKDIGELTANKTDFSLGSSLILPAGQTSVVDIYADAKTSTSTNLDNAETVQVSLATATNNAQGQSSLVSTSVPASNDVSGQSITVTSSSLTAAKFSGYGDQTVIAGANNAKIGAFTLSTGSTEGVTVNTVAISLSADNAASITNLTLKDASTGTIIGSVITTPSSGANSFSVNLDVPVSTTKTINIYANVLSQADNGPIVATVGTGTTGTGDSTGISASVSSTDLQTITVGSGTLSVTQGAGDPVSNNILAGASQVQVGQFQFSSTNSPFTVQNLAVLVPSGAATSVTNVTVSYKDVNGATQTQSQSLQLPSTTQAWATATFTGLTMYVPANDSANLDVFIGTPTIASAGGNISGTGIRVTLDDGNGSTLFNARDASGTLFTKFNANNTNIAANGTFYVRKSIPTFAVPTGQGGSIIPTNPLYRFSITADPAGAVEWSKLVFTVATSSATLTGVDLIDEASGNSILDNNVSSASTTDVQITIDLTKNNTQPKFQQVAAGATKTYDLDGTVSGFGSSGDSLTIQLAQDTGTPAANAHADTVGGSPNVVWSDRSATSHSISTSDWTNGAFLKNFTATGVSYSK